MVILGVDTFLCGTTTIEKHGYTTFPLGVFTCPDDEDEVLDLLINGPENPYEFNYPPMTDEDA